MPPPRQPLVTIPLQNPIGGVIRTISREEPPPVPCLANALNCLPYDLLGRKRLGQRGGVLPLYDLSPAGANGGLIQGMIQVGSIVQPGAIVAPAPYFPWTNIPGITTSTING